MTYDNENRTAKIEAYLICNEKTSGRWWGPLGWNGHSKSLFGLQPTHVKIHKELKALIITGF